MFPTSRTLTQTCRIARSVRNLSKHARAALPSGQIITVDERFGTLIYNPPSAAPSPLITPSAFIPAHARVAAPAPNTSSPQASLETLPPALRNKDKHEKKYHLTEKEFEEIRRLRAEGVSRLEIARRFDCSPFAVGMVAPQKKEVIEEQEKELKDRQKHWSKRKLNDRHDRVRRRALWGLDEVM
ncbi:hypothetical protein YB2330_006473 [Saitoella coloradoensis]